MTTPGALSANTEKFKSLFESGRATGFTIICDKKTWKVHSFVLNLYSDVLACACDGDFKIGRNETANRSIDLSVDGETSVAALVNYMYYFDYATDDECREPYTLHVNMILPADKYDMLHLLQLANDKAAVLLKDKPLDTTADLVEGARLSYEAEGPIAKFKDALVHATIKSSMKQSEQYSTIIRAIPALAQDVAIAMPTWKEHDKSIKETHTNCPSCGYGRYSAARGQLENFILDVATAEEKQDILHRPGVRKSPLCLEIQREAAGTRGGLLLKCA
nr:hypothetical protein B0A51_09710 [Rachicladosporium sp. CCFEE 5018]